MSEIIEKSGRSEIRAFGISKGNELNQFVKLLTNELAHLENNIVISSPQLITRDLDNQFVDLNDTVEIQLPAILRAKNYTDGDEVEIQDVKKSKYRVTLDKYLDVSVAFTTGELTAALEKGESSVIRSMTVAMRQGIDEYIANVIKNRTSGYYGVSGTTPNTIKHLTAMERMLNVENCPNENRVAVIDSFAKEEFLNLEEFKNMQYTGSTAGLFQSSMGSKFTLNMLTTNNVPIHEAGTYATNGVTHTVTRGANGKLEGSLLPYTPLTITEKSTTPVDGILKEGDIFKYEDATGKKYMGVVALDPDESEPTSTSGVITIKCVPAIPEGVVVTDTPLEFADKTTGGSVRNLVWQKSGVYACARPLRPYRNGQSISISSPENYPMRLSWGVDFKTKRTMLSMDMVLKGDVVRPELVKTMLG